MKVSADDRTLLTHALTAASIKCATKARELEARRNSGQPKVPPKAAVSRLRAQADRCQELALAIATRRLEVHEPAAPPAEAASVLTAR